MAGLGLGHVGVGVVGVGLGDGVDARADARDHGGVRLGVVDRASRGDDGVDEEGRRDDADGLLLWGRVLEVRLEGYGKEGFTCGVCAGLDRVGGAVAGLG